MAEIRLGRRRFPLPRSRPVRVGLGVALILGGVLGFLPILGFWMLPLGVIVLSVDSPVMRRLRRRTEVWWGRKRPFAGRPKPGPGAERPAADR
ncbi:hypothetical protein AB7M35_000159 [Amorphus suaedae]